MLKIDNNSFAFLVAGTNNVVSVMQEGKSLSKLSDAGNDVYIVKKGVPITLVSDVGEDVTVSITIPGGTIANAVTVGQTSATGYTFKTYSNETYFDVE